MADIPVTKVGDDNDININMASDDIIHVPVTPMYIKNVPGKGRGVYATEDIPSRTLINISPVLLFPEVCESSSKLTSTTQQLDEQELDKDHDEDKDKGKVKQTASTHTSTCPERDILAHYTYTFGHKTQALALGMGSMFNHSKRNNVGFIVDKVNLLIRYTTVKDVNKDSELVINYGNRLWFVDEEEGDQKCSNSSSNTHNNSDSDSDEDVDDPFRRMEL